MKTSATAGHQVGYRALRCGLGGLETHGGCPTMIKTKNKQIYKQTNTQTNKHFLDPKYLSQIKLDLCEIVRVYFCGCPMIIQTKNEQMYKQTNSQTNK